jgi:hypothetical protein
MLFFTHSDAVMGEKLESHLMGARPKASSKRSAARAKDRVGLIFYEPLALVHM